MVRRRKRAAGASRQRVIRAVIMGPDTFSADTGRGARFVAQKFPAGSVRMVLYYMQFGQAVARYETLSPAVARRFRQWLNNKSTTKGPAL